MNALDRIANLHEPTDTTVRGWKACVECSDAENSRYVAWPCPTRRLCEEAADRAAEYIIEVRAIVDDQLLRQRDAARADANAHADAIAHGLRLYERNAANIEFLLSACRTFTAAHDARTAETEK